MAMMEYQVLGALHDVLKHDVDEASQLQREHSPETTRGDTVLVVPFPGSTSGSK